MDKGLLQSSGALDRFPDLAAFLQERDESSVVDAETKGHECDCKTRSRQDTGFSANWRTSDRCLGGGEATSGEGEFPTTGQRGRWKTMRRVAASAGDGRGGRVCAR